MEKIVLNIELVNLHVMKNKIQEILNEDINVHVQYDDPNSHNSIRKINGICFILGNSVGLAIYESFYERLGKVCKDYKCILLGEDDDYWFIRNEINYIHGEDELLDYEKVIAKARKYIKDEIYHTNKI